MPNTNPTNDAPSRPDSCCSLSRRDFVRIVGLGAAGAAAGPWQAMPGPFEASDFAKLVPADKRLSPEWVRSLFERGTPTVYRGDDLARIGMPIGGICAGQLYLGGDGRLWHWDIFNQHLRTGSQHYAKPMEQVSPLEQGFAVRITSGGKTQVRPLNRAGFADTSFCGQYPIGRVDYHDPGLPLAVSLEAFSPFVPLDADNSSLPATVMRFTLKNAGTAPMKVELAGWLENAVCLHSAAHWQATRHNRLVRRPEMLFLQSSAAASPPVGEQRPPVVFADFEGPDYGLWKVEGEAFGSGPAKGPAGPHQRVEGFQGKGLVNTYLGSDKPRGKLTSPSFTIERNYICFLIGGGQHAAETCVNLLIDGKVVRTATGKNSDVLLWDGWDVRDLAGKTACIEIVDNHSGGWGHVDVDQIEFTDAMRGAAARIEDETDFGTMGLALLDPCDNDAAILSLPAGNLAEEIFPPQAAPAESGAQRPAGQRLIGALTRSLTLEPGQQSQATFVVAWHFANDRIPGLKTTSRRNYAKRFASAADVAQYVAKNFESLARQTWLWRDTWYDSTLPYWFLDRTLLNASILATSTCHWFEDNRFYGWEGVGCCPGTCTHVWHYAHAMARLFPALERSLRELTDYGVAFEEDTGRMRFRAEHNNHWAVDGQAGTILRVYREHQMSPNDQFLRRLWPRVKKSIEFLISKDESGDGILDGPQHNTLDADWWGQVAWLSGLYVTALRAGEEMARELGDELFARQCRAVFEKGRRNLCDKLYNGQYFIHRGDPAHADAIGSYEGCEIDQVFGQSWAWQVGLGRVLDEDKVHSALASLWRYNFTPDVGPYREAYKPGRWYAMPGEAGLLMCSWPRGEASRVKKSFDAYFNECMNGFEYQAAGHMIWEGMVQEGLAIARALHDRYHGSRRNPWNEVECGDHYARSMASYGVFLAACGCAYHGPRKFLAFDPRLTPDDFRAPFTAAEGWGTLAQKRQPGRQSQSIAVRWGKLDLRSLAFTVAEKARVAQATVTLGGQAVGATFQQEGRRVTVQLASDVTIPAGQTLEVVLTA